MSPLESGQIISHRCRMSPEEEKELDRYLILSVDGAWLKGYNLFTHPEIIEQLSAFRGIQGVSATGPGRMERIFISSIQSEEDAAGNYYWKIIS